MWTLSSITLASTLYSFLHSTSIGPVIGLLLKHNTRTKEPACCHLFCKLSKNDSGPHRHFNVSRLQGNVRSSIGKFFRQWLELSVSESAGINFNHKQLVILRRVIPLMLPVLQIISAAMECQNRMDVNAYFLISENYFLMSDNQKFLISENKLWYQKNNSWYQKIKFFKSENKWIFDIKNRAHFLISEIDFMISENDFIFW